MGIPMIGHYKRYGDAKIRGKVQISNITKCMGIKSGVTFAMARGRARILQNRQGSVGQG